MSRAATTNPDEAKPFLGAQIDAKFRDTLIEDAKKAAFFIRLMAMTLHEDETELRRILLAFGSDGTEAAELAADFITCREKLQGIADLMKTASGRVFLTLEQMEADGEITTTEAIQKPLEYVIDAISPKSGEGKPFVAKEGA